VAEVGAVIGRSQIAIVGVLRRGAPLADRLHARLADDWGITGCRCWWSMT
jgi:pyrimidine operon attenuation protein/uracil phosphoribosyltransferase